ncbi:MAG: efflux RND transporter periplasmic adaptor subunit [Bacteroidetes bacterium]|nr:efflux RND transporter periplasmic adaptor subunit [Bacteroidota bacterium]MCL2303391.1 efflux RND transporter periplasmic adaptor subunit [Lentimicrobiaceae bacterium]
MNKLHYPFFFIFLVFFIFSCKPKVAEIPIPEYKAMEIALSDGIVEVEYPTQLQSQQVIEIRPRVEGALEKVFIKEGAHVNKGEPLFQINPDVYQQQVLSSRANLYAAQAKLTNAEYEVQKVSPLVEKNIVSDYELKSANMNLKVAQAGVEQAQAALEQANINLGYTTITSPISGLASSINIREGALVQVMSQTPLTTISADGDMFAYFSVSERIVSPNERPEHIPKARLRLATGELYSELGKLDFASGIVNPTTGTVLLKAVFPNPKRELSTGSSGTIIIPFEVIDVVLVPKSATYQLLDKTMVVTLDENHATRSQVIAIAAVSGDNYVVSDGLKPGDVIVLEGVSKLRDGQTVKPIFKF